MRTTARERFALGIAALLLAAGAGVRFLQPDPAVPWAGERAGIEAIKAGAGESELEDRVAREVARAEQAATPLEESERIDPNTATATELDRLPEVGPATAERIVEHRETEGRFRTLADLDEVYGIGPALLETLAPHLALPPAAAQSSPPDRASAGDAPLDVNAATAAELDALPGIGPVLSERIIQWRTENGPFRSVDELDAVPGIGPHTLERLAPLVRAGM